MANMTRQAHEAVGLDGVPFIEQRISYRDEPCKPGITLALCLWLVMCKYQKVCMAPAQKSNLIIWLDLI